MLLMSQTMGCGRSKQQSPKNGEADRAVNGTSTKEKGAGKKKKSKDGVEPGLWYLLLEEMSSGPVSPWNGGGSGGQWPLLPASPHLRASTWSGDNKKENKDPQKANDKSTPDGGKTNKSSNNLLKPPPATTTTINGSSQQTLTIDVEYPGYKDKNEKGAGGKTKDGKEVSGKQPNIKVTNSQIEFFKMLDEKIEQGQDYGDLRSEESLEISTP